MSEQKLRIAHLHLQQADIFRQQSQLEPCIAEFSKAIDIYKEMVETEPAVWFMIADTLESIGATYKAAGELGKASETFGEAIALRSKLASVSAEKDPE